MGVSWDGLKVVQKMGPSTKWTKHHIWILREVQVFLDG